MTVRSWRGAATAGSLLLLCSFAFAEWTQVNVGFPCDLNAVHFPEGTQVGYAVGVGFDSLGGLVGVVVKTTDGGTAWAQQPCDVPGSLNSVYFTNNSTGFAVGDMGAAIRTTDGGAAWTPMTVPGTDHLNYVSFPGNGQTGYIGASSQSGDAKVIKTTDGGATWSAVALGGMANRSYSCGMADDTIGVVLGREGMVYGTTDGFATSAPQGPNTIADMIAAVFTPGDPNTGYLIGDDSGAGIIRYTDDFGASLWKPVKHYPVTAYYGLCMPAAGVAYFVGAGGRIDRTVASDDVYRCSTDATVDVHGVCFPNGIDTGYAVGAAGTVLKTTNGGIPWIEGVAEEKVPAKTHAGIRVLSNPSRYGIALHSDADVRLSVIDAAGRIVLSRTAAKGENFLALPTGAYFLKVGESTARAVVTD